MKDKHNFIIKNTLILYDNRNPSYSGWIKVYETTLGEFFYKPIVNNIYLERLDKSTVESMIENSMDRI